MDDPALLSSALTNGVLLAVDVILFRIIKHQLMVLLVQRDHKPCLNEWALPGSFVDSSEELEASAVRALYEGTGVTDVYLEQLYTFGSVNRDPRGRVVCVTYIALISPDRLTVISDGMPPTIRWLPVNDLPDLAFDHSHIVEYALTRLRAKLEYTSLGFRLMPEQFTLTELQQMYEAILNERLDKRNFRRKILQSGVLIETGAVRAGDGRPAKLFRYRTDAQLEIKARRLFP